MRTKTTVFRPIEKKIEASVCIYAKSRGVMVTKFTSPGYRGMPDRIFWVPGGKPLLVEFKRLGGSLSALQGYVKLKLESLGYEVKIIDNVQAGKSAIDTALEAAQVPNRRVKVDAKP